MPIEKKDRPDIKLELQNDQLNIGWGPQRGPWGIFRKGASPVEVDIEEWQLYVGTTVHKLKPDQGTEGSKEIFAKSVGSETKMIIQLGKHDLHKKTVVAQVIGIFNSQKEDGEQFKEGIYSDVAQIEID